MKRYLPGAFAVIAFLFVTSCGADALPTESDGKSVLTNLLKVELETVPFVIKSFKKTDSKKMTIFGKENYIMEYKAKIEYPKGIMPECLEKDIAGEAQLNCLFQSRNGVEPKKVGATETRSGNIGFEMTENGWRGDDGNIY